MLLWCTEGSGKHDELPCFHFIKCHEAAFWVCTPVWFFRSNSGHVFATSEVGLTLLCCWLSRVLTTGFIQTWCSRIEWPSFCLCQQEFSFRQVAFWGAILSGKVVGLSWCKVMVRRHICWTKRRKKDALLTCLRLDCVDISWSTMEYFTWRIQVGCLSEPL